MPTIARELVDRLRTEFLDDAVGAIEDDYRWKTAEILAGLSWAQDQLARRLLLIEDSTTVAVCQATISVLGDGTYPRTFNLHNKVLRVEMLLFPGITRPLVQASVGFLDQFDPGWHEKTGNPTHFTVNPQSRAITFNRQPTSGGTALLTVKRLPLVAFTMAGIDSEATEIDYDTELMHGALVKLYGKDDKRTFNPTRSRKWSQQFDQDIREIMRDRAALSPAVHVMSGQDY